MRRHASKTPKARPSQAQRIKSLERAVTELVASYERQGVLLTTLCLILKDHGTIASLQDIAERASNWTEEDQEEVKRSAEPASDTLQPTGAPDE